MANSIKENQELLARLLAEGRIKPAPSPPIPTSYPIPSADQHTGLSLSRGPLPRGWGLDTDTARQSLHNSSIPQIRVMLQPSTADPVVGSQATSQSNISAFTAIGQALPGVTSGNPAAASNIAAATLDNVSDSKTFGRVHGTALTNNNIDPSKSGVMSRGNTPYSIATGFTYASTTSSITWSWTGLTIYRSDGTTTAIANGSQLISGLSASTTYFFYPFFNDSSGTLQWVAGGTGSPAYAQAATSPTLAQTQNLQGQIPLSGGGLSAATPASGSGGGSGGGGGGGGCFSGNCAFLTPTGYTVFSDPNLRDGLFEIENETGAHLAKLVVHDFSGTLIDMGDGRLVTEEHLMKTSQGWTPSNLHFPEPQFVRVAVDKIQVFNMHVLSDSAEDLHYILENGEVAHNLKTF